MTKGKKKWMAIMLLVGLMMLTATPAFARAFSLKGAGVALWSFIIIGAVIILLQLIPAAILFFSFIGTTSAIVFRGKKEKQEETDITPPNEPTSKKSN